MLLSVCVSGSATPPQTEARDTRRSRAVPRCVAVRSAIVPLIALSKPTMHLIICPSHLCDQGSHGVLGGDATLLHHLPDRSLFCRELIVEIAFYQRSFDVFMSFSPTSIEKGASMFKMFLKLCLDNFTLGEKVQLIHLLELKMILYFQISYFVL